MSHHQFRQFFSNESYLLDNPLADAGDELQSSCEEIFQLSQAIGELSELQVQVEGLHLSSPQHLMLAEQTLIQIGQNIGQDWTVPSMENAGTGATSRRSFTERIRDILKWIRDRFRYLINRVRGLFAKAKSDVAYLKARLYILKEKHRQFTGRYPSRPELDLSGIVHQVLVREGVPKGGRMLIRDATELQSQLDALRRRYLPIVQSVASKMSRVMDGSTYRQGLFQEWLEQMNESAYGMRYSELTGVLPNLLRVDDTRFPKDSTKMATPLIGDRAIFILDGGRGQGGVPRGGVELATVLQNTRMVLARSRPTNIAIGPSPTMSSMPHSMIGDILNLVEGLLTDVEKIDVNAFKAEFDAISQRIDSMIRAVPSTGRSASYVESGVRYSAALTRWVSDPYLTLLAHTLSSCRGLMSVCVRALNAL